MEANNTGEPNRVTQDLIIFSDFDGTIAKRDVGNRLFYHFSEGRSEAPVAEWRAGKIDSQECLRRSAELTRDLTEAEFYAFLDGFELDPAFSEFVMLVRQHTIPLYILSDGLDLYIEYLLKENGLDSVPFFSNRAEIIDGRLKITWPYMAQSCGDCGNCKGYHIRRLKMAHHKVVYIGDGKSDICAVPEADIIFARGYLADYCRESKIGFFAFDNFSSVTDIMRTRFISEHENRV